MSPVLHPLRAFSCLVLALALPVVVAPAVAQESSPPEAGVAGIDERLGERAALDLVMVNEHGDSVRLESLVDKPTVVALVYYTCPSICRPLLDEVADVLEKLSRMQMDPGVDYRVLTVSFDERDRPEDSARLKKEYATRLPPSFPDSAWTFLTSDKETIGRFAQSVGFGFKRVGDAFIHPSALIVMSPGGKITRYLYGAEYLPLDVKMAIYEASEGRVGPTIARMLRICYSYDPEGRKYVLNVTRIVGGGMILTLVGFALYLSAVSRRRAREMGN
jgi:protein SCO1/2